MADIPISDLDLGTLSESSLFYISYMLSGILRSGKISAADLGAGFGTTIPFPTLNTGSKTLFGAINELNAIGGHSIVVTGTLTAGSTTLTLSNTNIHTDSWLVFYSDTLGVYYTNRSVSEGSVTLTFPAQSSDVNIGVEIRGVSAGGGGGIEYLFLPTDLIPNTYIDRGAGQAVSYSGWSATDFIEVTSGEEITFATGIGDNYNCWYDANKAMVSNFQPTTLMGGSGYGKITIPNGVSYFRMSSRDSNMNHTRAWRESGGT